MPDGADLWISGGGAGALLALIGYVLREAKAAHRRVSSLREEHNRFVVEVHQTFVARQDLKEFVLKPLEDRLVRIETKIDNGLHGTGHGGRPGSRVARSL